MEAIDYWRLCEVFTVRQAALLIVGVDPSTTENYVDGWTDENKPEGYVAVTVALRTSIENGSLAATIRFAAERRDNLAVEEIAEDDAAQEDEKARRFGGEWIVEHVSPPREKGDVPLVRCFRISTGPDWSRTTVTRNDLVTWLRQRKFRSEFFSTGDTDIPDYLDSEHPRYAPKLAAAVTAWCALDAPSSWKNTSPKQALTKWLNEHARDFKLSDGEGMPIKQGIEDVAKVANWKPEGGAPTTPVTRHR